MRIGSAIVFLVVILLVCGFLFSDNLHMRNDLATATEDNVNLLGEKEALQAQLDIANSDIAALRAQNEELERQVLLLGSQIRQIQEEKRLIENQSAQLQTQLDQMKKINPVIENLTGQFPQSLKLALLVPILPLSLATTFVIYRYSQRHGRHKNDQPDKPKRHILVKLTDEEMKEIIKMRRKG